jgi:site-specific DNA-methyltransferase (adenine-specific)
MKYIELKSGKKWPLNTAYEGDCLDFMREFPDKCIDMILCDLPYGTTACAWDVVIPFRDLWEGYSRIIKDNGSIVLTSSQPFTTDLINSKREWFRYSIIWDKLKAGNIFLAEHQPMKVHEDISVFSKEKHKYNPVMIKRDKIKRSKNYGTGETMGGKKEAEDTVYEYDQKYPESIIQISNASQTGKIHPTQKPVKLFEYLIQTYTDKNNIVLDNCLGSFTTAIASHNLQRNWIGCEKDPDYFKAGMERYETECLQNLLDF